MPFSNLAEREQEILGPDTVAVLAAALEDAITRATVRPLHIRIDGQRPRYWCFVLIVR